jgi:2,3-bisphosphoglycerate-dependent phosphoglycerate mutase
VGIEIVFETHSTTEDNEAGRATGWLPGRLSEQGRAQARELGRRRAKDGVAAVFCSDLRRAVQTAELAFDGSGVPVLHDWRLRECDYGELNGMPAAEMHAGRRDHLDVPYPGGESWRQAVALGGAADRGHRARRDPLGAGSRPARRPGRGLDGGGLRLAPRMVLRA